MARISAEKTPWITSASKGLFYGSIQASLGNIILSSKFSLIDSPDDQKYLDEAMDTLRYYIILAAVWTVATSFIAYGENRSKGVIANLLLGTVLTLWIVISYHQSYVKSAEKFGLKVKDINFVWLALVYVGILAAGILLLKITSKNLY